MTLLLLLMGHFLLLSLIAIGGASATLPEMHRVLVGSLHLMSDTEFSQLYSLSQAAPGPNVLFVALFGWQVAGFWGSVVCMFSMCGPSSLLALGVEHFGSSHQNDKWYVVVRQALMPVAMGLLLSTALILMQMNPHPVPIFATLITFILLLRFKFNPLWLVAVGALLGVTGVIS